MAGDWLKVEKATSRKPEVLRLAATLGISRREAFALCFEFWKWCDDQLESCYANGVTELMIDEEVGCVGFASALLDVGWLQVRNGSLEVPNFDRHLSQGAKSRALTAARMKKQRLKNSDDKVTRKPSPEKRREEKNKDSLTENLNTPLPPLETLLQKAWNATEGVIKFDRWTDKRKTALRARSATDWPWEAAIAKFPLKCFSDPGGWRPDIEWFLRPDSVTKILEGKYDWSKDGKQRTLIDNSPSKYDASGAGNF